MRKTKNYFTTGMEIRNYVNMSKNKVLTFSLYFTILLVAILLILREISFADEKLIFRNIVGAVLIFIAIIIVRFRVNPADILITIEKVLYTLFSALMLILYVIAMVMSFGFSVHDGSSLYLYVLILLFLPILFIIISKWVKEKVILVAVCVLLLINILFFLIMFFRFGDVVSAILPIPLLITFFIFTPGLVYFIILSFKFIKHEDPKIFYKLSAYTVWITYFNLFIFFVAIILEIVVIILSGPFILLLASSMFIACITFIFLPNFMFTMLFKIFFDFKIAGKIEQFNTSPKADAEIPINTSNY